MHPAVRAAFLPFTVQYEGICLWMYLDIKGLVTTGIGNLVDPDIPYHLDWRDKNGHPVPASVVAAEWHRIKSMTAFKNCGGGYFRNLTELRLSQSGVEALVAGKLAENETYLMGYFPGWATFPADAQLAILSIAWACGAHFPRTWPRFTAAVNAGDWIGAASQSHIEDAHNPGLKPRNIANRTLLLNAEVSDDPATLIWTV